MTSMPQSTSPGFFTQLIWDLKQIRRDRLQPGRDQAALEAWEKSGRPVPPPDLVKRRTLAAYGKAFHTETLVETGTYLGGTMFALRNDFKKLYSIELSHELVLRARRRFGKIPHIQILEGDSGTELANLVKTLKAPSLFWLDGHYSGGFTAQASLDTPIIRELQTIFAEPYEHVILIDDARLFDGTHDYPTIDELRELFAKERPEYHFSVSNDMIRACPVGKVEDPYPATAG